MKRYIAMLMMFVMVLSLAACGDAGGSTSGSDASVPDSALSSSNDDDNYDYLASGAKMYVPDSSKAETVLRFAWTNTYDTDHPYTAVAAAFATYIDEATDGRIVVELYPAGQLGAEREMLEMLLMGSLDFGIISAPIVSNFSDATFGLEMPFIWGTDGNKALSVMKDVLTSDIGDIILEGIEKDLDIRALTYAYQPFRHIWLNTKLNSWDDVAGLKLRSMEVESNLKLWSTLGFSPVAMAFSDVYTQIQQGTLDGMESDYIGFYTNALNEVCDYGYVSSHFNNTPIIFAASKTMNSLSAEDAQIIQEAAEYAADWSYEVTVEQEEIYRQKILDYGVEIIELDLTPLVEKVQPMIQEYCEQSEVCDQFVKAVREAVSED